MKELFNNKRIWVRGAGELASACAQILHGCGFSVVVSELSNPFAIRRTVTFSDAVQLGTAKVEGATARLCEIADIEGVLSQGDIALVIDDLPELRKINWSVVIDARMMKKEISPHEYGDHLSIGLGPGFTAGANCRAVIETKRGHELGRIIWDGAPVANTGIPGVLGGETFRRIISAPASGKVEWKVEFGSIVHETDLVGIIDKQVEVRAPLGGIVRGLISPQTNFVQGTKIGDIDPRGKEINIYHISEKARLVGRGVLEAVIQLLNNQES